MARFGHQVTSPTRGQIEELFEFRTLLEGWCAVEAAQRIRPEEVAELRAIDCAWNPSEFSSYIRSLDRNRQFHGRIAEIAGSAVIAEALNGVLAQITRALNMGLIYNSDASRMMDEHLSLIDALEAHDPERAARIAREQVQHAQRMVLSTIDRSLNLATVELSRGALDLPMPSEHRLSDPSP